MDLQYSHQTLFKALHWLKQQPEGISSHIKDSRIAVKMYLKSQDQHQTDSQWSKSLSKYLKISNSQQKDKLASLESTFKNNKLKKTKTNKLAIEQLNLSTKDLNNTCLDKQASLFPSDLEQLLPKRKTCHLKKQFELDKISLQSLRQIQQEFNIKSEEEALRFLIQFAKKSLQKLFSDPKN